MIIRPSDCGYTSTRDGHVWVFWLGDHKISQVPVRKIMDFITNFSSMIKLASTKLRLKAIIEALEILSLRALSYIASKDDLYAWGKNGFRTAIPNLNDVTVTAIVPVKIHEYLEHLRSKTKQNIKSNLFNKVQANQNVWPLKEMENVTLSNEIVLRELQVCLQRIDFKETENVVISSKKDNFIDGLKAGHYRIEDICISCCEADAFVVIEHPFFKGGLCSLCEENFKESAFAVGGDGKHVCCIICSEPGELYICEKCPRSYCQDCLRLFLDSENNKKVQETSEWMCFFCSPENVDSCLLEIKKDWELKFLSMFTSTQPFVKEISLIGKRPITVLSLFDGISTGKVVLDLLQIEINKYYSSEINENAINVSKFHHKDSIVNLGDIRNITEAKLKLLGQIDLIIGGSPCNDLSLVNPARKGIYDWQGSGDLFFDFSHILNLVKKMNKNVFYLFENVVTMSRMDKGAICETFLEDPILVDAKYYSPQTRRRNFWGNIPGLCNLPNFWNSNPEKVGNEYLLQSYVLPYMGRTAQVNKIRTVTTQRNSLIQKQGTMPVLMNGKSDVLWITELEMIFGFPCHYTDTGNLGIVNRRKLLGRSWSVPVVKAIFHPLKHIFKCKDE